MDNKHILQTTFIFGLFGIFFILIVAMMYPFWTVLLWLALMYILLRPLYQRCVGSPAQPKGLYTAKRYFFAGVFSIGTLILIIGPIILLSVLLVHQMFSFLASAENFISSNPHVFESDAFIGKALAYAEKFGIPVPPIDVTNIHASLLSLLHRYNSQLFALARGVVSKTGAFLFSLLFIVFALYFCFLDGSYLASLIKKAIPIKPLYMRVILTKFKKTTGSLFSGYILVALYQGIVSLIIMLLFRVQGALLFSVILMFASFIPLLGTALIWLPVGIAIIMTDSLWKGVAFIIASAICVSLLDNFLRPLFLKDRIHVHPLVIFFSILGGIKVFGMNGLILGPMIVIMFFTVLDLLVDAQESKVQNDLSESPDADLPE